MNIPEYWFFQNLYTAKHLADSGYLKSFLQDCGSFCVDDEVGYELAWSGISSVFPDFRNYFHEEIDGEILVLFDPLIDEFCRLCRLHEEREGLPFGTSPLRVSAEREIYNEFEFYGYHYDYDFRFYHAGHGRGKMVVLMGMEFCAFDQLPATLADVHTELEAQVCKLRKELAPKALPKKKSKKKTVKEAA